MILQTQIPLKPENNQINYTSKIVLLGSCFAENMGEKLAHLKFQSTLNHFGILFNPVAIEKLIKRAISETAFTEEDIFFHNEQWHCFEVHSSLSNVNKNTFLANLNEALVGFRHSIINASHIIFTYGTAWVYREIESNTIVANCHKVSQQKFRKELLSPDKVSEVLLNIEDVITSVNPDCVLINTVSPVRHIKDGIVENSRSKAHLLTAIHTFLNRTSKVESLKSFYFPSFEIMMDELRDYRFYTKDMLHPNETAIEIIWEKFKTVWISSETEPLQKKILEIQNGLNHRPFNATSDGHKKFLSSLEKKISEVKKVLPFLEF